MKSVEDEVFRIKKFIKESTRDFHGVIIGLSGGIDSSLVA